MAWGSSDSYGIEEVLEIVRNDITTSLVRPRTYDHPTLETRAQLEILEKVDAIIQKHIDKGYG